MLEHICAFPSCQEGRKDGSENGHYCSIQIRAKGSNQTPKALLSFCQVDSAYLQQVVEVEEKMHRVIVRV